ncbi:hypothetical protein DV736_g2172, partial [Chaetothyriales sp. CBS 134916]
METAAKKIAIVGSGCSGLGALWALKSTHHEVHLFEALDRLGGHTNMVRHEPSNGSNVVADTNCIVMNTRTHPNLINFLGHVGIETATTEVTLAMSRDQGSFEWANTSLNSLFCQRRNLFRLDMWMLIVDTIRFNEFAMEDLIKESVERLGQQSIGSYLDHQGYSHVFRDHYLIPIITSVCGPSRGLCALDIPAITVVSFLWNHHLLSSLATRPHWITLPGGTNAYMEVVLHGFPKNRIHTESKVTAVVPSSSGPVTVSVSGREDIFDHVILAIHGDEAFRVLGTAATAKEASILSSFHSSGNVAVLHSDLSLMPKSKRAWSACNYLTESEFPPTSKANMARVSLTYSINQLHHLPHTKYGPILLTLNPLEMPDHRLAQAIWSYSSHLYDAEADRMQSLLPRIQNTRSISFCGAWTMPGFNQDGYGSGLAVAVSHLGAKLPFDLVDTTFPPGPRIALAWKHQVIRMIIPIVHAVVLLLEMVWAGTIASLEIFVAKRRKLA